MAENIKVNRKQFLKEHHKSSKIKEMWQIFSHNHLAMVGLVLFILIMLSVIFADVIADYDAMAIAVNPLERLQFPSESHILGTDELGRDVFARIIHGGRISLSISVGAAVLGIIIAGVIGAISGYCGGTVDTILMRIIDVFACVPCIVLTIALVAALGNSMFNLILALAITTVVGGSRVIRASVLSVRNMEYVEAARAIGQKTWIIITKHILVNCIAPIIVHFTMIIAANILTIAELSFLGLGITAPTPEWGCMIATSRANMRQYAYLVIAPGIAIFLSSVAFNLMGDGLRDAFDPKLKR